MRLLLLPGVASLLQVPVGVLGQGSHLLHIHQDPVLGLGVSLHCVGITGGVTTKVAAVGGVCMETVLMFGEVAALLRLKITHITEVVTSQLVQNEIMFCLHMLKYFILLSSLMGAMGAVVAAQLMNSQLVSVDDRVFLSFECAAIQITVNICVLLQVDVLNVLLKRTSVFRLIFALVTREANVLVFSFIMLLETGSVATLVVTLITLVKYPCNTDDLHCKTVTTISQTFVNTISVILQRLRAFKCKITLIAHISKS